MAEGPEQGWRRVGAGSTQGRCRVYARSAQDLRRGGAGSTHGRRRIYAGAVQGLRRIAMPLEKDDGATPPSTPPMKRKRKRRRRRSPSTSSSSSSSEERAPRKVRKYSSRLTTEDVLKLLADFKGESSKSSSFSNNLNNVVPEFDPSNRAQTIEGWLKKNFTELPFITVLKNSDRLTFYKSPSCNPFTSETDEAPLKLYIAEPTEVTETSIVTVQAGDSTYTEREKVRETIDELLRNDIIQESSSSYSSPILMVKKKTGEQRLCVDFRALNNKTCKDRFPLPIIDDQISNLSGNAYFTTLDLASGYYQGGEEGTPNWVCPGCASGNQPPAPIVDAPVAEGMDSLELPEPVVSDGRHNSTANDTTEEFKVELGLEIRLFREELSAVREELRLFRAEERLSTLDSRVDVLEKRVMEGTGSRLESVIAELRLELNEKDQELLGNDVEVSNLPEENGENATHMIMAVATKLGVTLRESDIAPGAGRGGDAGAGAAGRPRPLVVRFTRRAVKDELTAAARVRRGATSADLSQSSAPRPFYVNERLTKYNRQLYYQTREVGRRLSWRFLWTKKGRIYARQGQDTPRHWIRSADDISRVFGVAS
ncbi:unnamed protein product [Plutella xylostella]|uniref:(diamondback moth) hypothetical protein n=1 Tax=Plutella xylostella TaxID=51655 RepID=A0A8S4G0U5_PLUXY|nr:unnamed protein product [Plutella xylostella]